MITIVTFHSPSFKAISDITLPVNRAYAKRHGYHFKEYPADESRRHPSWSRIPAMISSFPFSPKGDNWLMCLDADAVVTNPKYFTIEEFCFGDPETAYDVIFSEAFNGINVGVFLMRDTPASLDFLRQVWNQTQFIEHGWLEQRAILHLLGLKSALTEAGPNLCPDLRVKIIPNAQFNRTLDVWKRGDFILHAAGAGDERPAILKAALEGST